jgi:hypothetical protein
MTTRFRLVRLPAVAEVPGARDGQRGPTWLDRSVQIALVLYLIPALLVVLVLGGLGMLILAVARLLIGAGRGRASIS